jgi:hypothetical protein
VAGVPDHVAATVTAVASAAAAPTDALHAVRRRRRDAPARAGTEPASVGGASAVEAPEATAAAGPDDAAASEDAAASDGAEGMDDAAAAGTVRRTKVAPRSPESGADRADSTDVTSPAVGRCSGSRAVIAPSTSAHRGPSSAGISGWRLRRTTAVSIPTPGNAARPVRHSSSTSPRA